MVDWKESERLLTDIRAFPEFCEKYLKIKPEEGGDAVAFKLRPIQKWYHKKFIVPSWEKDLPIRDCILKSRQMGFSTYIDALEYWFTLGGKNRRCLVIGKDKAQTAELFGIFRNYDRFLPDADPVLPYFYRDRDAEDQIAYQSPPRSKMKQFEDKPNVVFLNSTVKTKSAEEKDALGRAGTYQFVHASEAAYWPRLTRSLGSLLSCCHDHPQTAVFIETTANGMNAFQTFWQYLRVGKREVPTLWRKVFVPWYWDSRYELSLKIAHAYESDYEEYLFKKILADEELRSFDRFVTEERAWAKIFWRRQTLLDKTLGDEEMFKQEFPATEEEAFMFSGESAFANHAIRHIETTIREPVWRGNIRLKRKEGEDPGVAPSVIETDRHEFGQLKVFEKPTKEDKYCIGADIAEGKAAEGISEDKSKWDYSCAQIFSITTYPPSLRQVAVWHGNCDPDLYGDILVALARTYNNAFLAWEMNGPGRSIGMQIIERHRYSNIYMRDDTDAITHRPTQKPGWKTTRRTKPEMVATAKRFVRGNEVVIYDGSTLTEMKAFSRVGENQWEAAHGHDDRVMALCVALTTVEPMIGTIKRQADWEKQQKLEEEERLRRKEEEEDQYNPSLGTEW